MEDGCKLLGICEWRLGYHAGRAKHWLMLAPGCANPDDGRGKPERRPAARSNLSLINHNIHYA